MNPRIIAFSHGTVVPTPHPRKLLIERSTACNQYEITTEKKQQPVCDLVGFVHGEKYDSLCNMTMTTATIKCVVWDLDHTLWNGVLLERDELALMPGVEDVIKELDDRGILQSIASKNDYAAAWNQLAAFGLDDYFLYPQISWANKSDSIKTIANKLNLGLDTFVLIDDQAFERDEVRYYLPDVTTIDAADISRLTSMPGLQPRFRTRESRIRRKIYQADIQRNRMEDEFPGTRKEYLETLGMRVTIRLAGEADLQRAEELTIRTNQLNTTGRVYSYEELSECIDSRNHVLLVTELDDCYGPSGTVGLALIEHESNAWVVKLLITSCRVMTRGLGDIMLSYILQSAKRSGIRLRALYVPNERNRMVYVTLKFHGFYEVSKENGQFVLEHALENVRPFPSHVAIQVEEQEAAFGFCQRKWQPEGRS